MPPYSETPQALTVTLKINAELFGKDLLLASLGCEEGQLADRLAEYGTAALIEYLTMITGKRFFSKAADYEEERLMNLIDNVFGREIPREKDITRIFHCTPAHSKTLLANARARSPRRVDGAIVRTFMAAVAKVAPDENGEVSVRLEKEVAYGIGQLIAEAPRYVQSLEPNKDADGMFNADPSALEYIGGLEKELQ